MSNPKKLALSIGGYDFFIKVDEDPKSILKLAKKLDDDIFMAKQTNPYSPTILNIILTALDYSEKLNAEQLSCDSIRSQLNDYMTENEKLKAEIKKLKQQK